MKNVKRFLCFFMCICLCFAWFGPPIEVSAGWVALIPILVVWMASLGVSVVASDSLENVIYPAYEEWLEEFMGSDANWRDMSLSDWSNAILEQVAVNNAGYISVGTGAAVMLNEFAEWFRDNVAPVPGGELEVNAAKTTVLNMYVNGELASVRSPIVDVTYPEGAEFIACFTGQYFDEPVYTLGEVVTYGDVYPVGTIFSGTTVPGGDYYRNYIIDDNWDVCQVDPFTSGDVVASGAVGSLESPSAASTLACYGYDSSAIVGVGFIIHNHRNLSTNSRGYIAICYYLNDGNACVRVKSQGCHEEYSQRESVGSLSVSTSGLQIPDSSQWGEGEIVLNTGDIKGSSVSDISYKIGDVVSDGSFSVSLEMSDVLDPSVPDEGDSSLASTVSSILSLLKSLPQNLANLILDGLKSIFIPDPEQLETMFLDLLAEIYDIYEFDFDLGALFAEGRPPDNIKAEYFAGSKVKEMTFVDWKFLISAVEGLRKYIRGFIVVMLVFFNLRQFMSVLNMVSLEGGYSAPSPDSSTSVVVYKGR